MSKMLRQIQLDKLYKIFVKPVKLRGELSQGMILAGTKGKKLQLATIDGTLPNGARVK